MYGLEFIESKEQSKKMLASRLFSPQEVFHRLLIFSPSRMHTRVGNIRQGQQGRLHAKPSLGLAAYSENSNR